MCYHPPRIHPFPRCLFLDADSNSKEAGTYPPGTFEEEDEETKIKSLFEYVKWEGSEEKYRPFVTKRQLVRKLEENGVHLSTNRLTRHMKGWGYPAGDRKNGERGWYDIKFVNSTLDGSGDF